MRQDIDKKEYNGTILLFLLPVVSCCLGMASVRSHFPAYYNFFSKIAFYKWDIISIIEALNGWRLISTLVIQFAQHHHGNKQKKNRPTKLKKKNIYIFFINRSRFQNSVSTRILLSVLSITRETPTTITEDCCVFNVLGPLFDEKWCITIIPFISMDVIYIQEKTSVTDGSLW